MFKLLNKYRIILKNQIKKNKYQKRQRSKLVKQKNLEIKWKSKEKKLIQKVRLK